MEFNNTFGDLSIDSEICLNGATVNSENEFMRGLKPDHTEIKADDFNSYYEDKKPVSLNSDDAKCMYRGVSLCMVDDTNEQQIIEHLFSLHAISPKSFGQYAAKFRLPSGCGMVKKTPSKKVESHCTFYKCDCFLIEKIQDPEIIDLLSHVTN